MLEGTRSMFAGWRSFSAVGGRILMDRMALGFRHISGMARPCRAALCGRGKLIALGHPCSLQGALLVWLAASKPRSLAVCLPSTTFLRGADGAIIVAPRRASSRRLAAFPAAFVMALLSWRRICEPPGSLSSDSRRVSGTPFSFSFSLATDELFTVSPARFG